MSGSIHPLTKPAPSYKIKSITFYKYSVSFLLSYLSLVFCLVLCFYLSIFSLHLFYILTKASRGMRESMRYVKKKTEERSAHCKRVMRNPLQANGIQRQRLANFQSNYLAINALRGVFFFSAVPTHFTWLNSQFFAKTIRGRFGAAAIVTQEGIR